MKKILLSIFLLPLIFGFSSGLKTTNNVEFAEKSGRITRNLLSNAAQDFVDYWYDDFRDPEVPVCDITYASYSEMYQRYQVLSKEDRAEVNATADNIQPEYTIGDIIKTLVAKYYPNNSKNSSEKKKLDQSAIIIIAVVVALVGASSISILYILRNQKVIE